MLKSERADQDWQALRYAVDQLDLCWSHEFPNYEGEELKTKRDDMMKHRAVLVNLQESALRKKHAYEEIEK